jgi:hypothetical protein
MRGLAEGLDPAGFTDAPTGIVVSNDPVPSYNDLITQGVNPIDAAAYDPLGACAVDPNCSMPLGTSTIIPFGTPGGQMTGGLPTPAQLAAAGNSAFSPAQIAAAIKAGTLIAATASSPGVGTPGHPICPSGVAYPTGQCFTVTKPSILPGVPNQTLAIAALVFFAFMMIGKRR